MAEESQGVIGRIGRGITTLRNFFVNGVFIALLALAIVVLVNSCQTLSVPKNAALLINPQGIIVDAATLADPLEGLLSRGQAMPEVELSALLTAIESATQDDNIKMIILDLDNLAAAAPAHAQRIGKALVTFQQADKKVVAYGYFYSQAQYHIASFADALYMHPMGQVFFQGFGGSNFYFNELLERFKVNVHVYRVGDYKSAVEPLTRNDMSEESRLASETLYQNIWQHLLDDIAANRMVTKAELQTYADNLADTLVRTKGDLARAALETHLVDELLTADQAQVRMANDVGYSDAESDEINSIDYQTYLDRRNLLNPEILSNNNQIAVITAQGMIVTQSQDQKVAAANTLIDLIQQAKRDDNIKAVVLRVDSPGGSQFASELIRQEIELLQLSGKPVVASFGATAASGGYWISATADAIIAEATTVTGSIGIFSYITTFEDTLADYGVHTDGVGTTAITLGMGPFTGINEPMAKILQARVEHGYRQFLQLVARGRDMSVEAVDEVAQGRVWTGETAKELGLVDDLGGMALALQKAAELADLETWSSIRLNPPIDARAAILAELMAPDRATVNFRTNSLSVQSFSQKLKQMLNVMDSFDDPMHIYVLCETCSPLTKASTF